MKKFPAKKLTRSVRKYVREEKARIRRAFPDIKLQKQKIAELYGQFGVAYGK